MNENSIMNIIAQSYYHTPAAIIGNERALKTLRDAIDSALENGTGGTCVMPLTVRGISWQLLSGRI